MEQSPCVLQKALLSLWGTIGYSVFHEQSFHWLPSRSLHEGALRAPWLFLRCLCMAVTWTMRSPLPQQTMRWAPSLILCEVCTLRAALSCLLPAARSPRHLVVGFKRLLPPVICESARKRQRKSPLLVAVGMAGSR